MTPPTPDDVKAALSTPAPAELERAAAAEFQPDERRAAAPHAPDCYSLLAPSGETYACTCDKGLAQRHLARRKAKPPSSCVGCAHARACWVCPHRKEADLPHQEMATAGVARLRAALEEAARSLETIRDEGGCHPYLIALLQIRQYAHSRATVARAALAPQEKP